MMKIPEGKITELKEMLIEKWFQDKFTKKVNDTILVLRNQKDIQGFDGLFFSDSIVVPDPRRYRHMSMKNNIILAPDGFGINTINKSKRTFLVEDIGSARLKEVLIRSAKMPKEAERNLESHINPYEILLFVKQRDPIDLLKCDREILKHFLIQFGMMGRHSSLQQAGDPSWILGDETIRDLEYLNKEGILTARLARKIYKYARLDHNASDKMIGSYFKKRLNTQSKICNYKHLGIKNRRGYKVDLSVLWYKESSRFSKLSLPPF